MIKLKSITILALIFLSGTVVAQSWLDRYNESLELYNQEEYVKSLATGEEALIQYKREGDINHSNYMAILRQLSVNAYIVNDLNKAKGYAQTEVDSWRTASRVDENIFEIPFGQVFKKVRVASLYIEAIFFCSNLQIIQGQRIDIGGRNYGSFFCGPQ